MARSPLSFSPIARDARILAGWCTIPGALTAEVVARAGFGAVVIDMQHGLLDYASALSMLQVAQALNPHVLCRLASPCPHEAARMLDAGFSGLVCPGIADRAGALAFVRATRFPPAGTRSFGAARGPALYGPAYTVEGDGAITRLVMIQSAAALSRVDDILDVEGIDGLYLALSDLSLDLGLGASQSLSDPRIEASARRALEVAARAGKLAGLHVADIATANAMLELGFNIAGLKTDLRILSDAIAELVAQARLGTA